MLRKLILLFGSLLAPASPPVQAQNVAPQASVQTKYMMMLAPYSDFYPHYMADPRRAQSALTFMYLPSSGIPAASSSRVWVRLGSRVPLIRFHPKTNPNIGWQVDLDAGFFAQFDLAESLDNVGWDGIYGLTATYRPSPRLAYRFGTLHDSAHVGDEYAEETGRRRIDYTREEWIAGLSWTPQARWRFYAEAAWAYESANNEQDERLQAGVEYYGRRRFWANRLNWYGAMDLNLFHERERSPAGTIQLGFILPAQQKPSRLRLALEIFNGRSPLGEFSFHDESYIGLGLYFDN